MPLDQNQIDKANAWFSGKKVRNLCESCGGQQWSLGEVINGTIYAGGNLVVGGPSVPMLQMACGNCGYIRLYSAVLMGLVS